MLATTAHAGEVAYNTADATLWFVHAVERHVDVTGDDDLAAELLADLTGAYLGRHRGDPSARDRAYHQGTVWPWLIGPYVEAARKTGVPVEGVLEPLERHLHDWGLGSVSETADGDPPHDATGCPFQAWSVAELLRARRLAAR